MADACARNIPDRRKLRPDDLFAEDAGGTMSVDTNKAWKSLRTWIEGLTPYRSLALLAVPLCVVEPLKLVAVAVAGKGHWLGGALTVAAAYAGSLLIVEQLFSIVRPKLLKLRWFARIWARIVVCRCFLMASLRGRANEAS